MFSGSIVVRTNEVEMRCVTSVVLVPPGETGEHNCWVAVEWRQCGAVVCG